MLQYHTQQAAPLSLRLAPVHCHGFYTGASVRLPDVSQRGVLHSQHKLLTLAPERGHVRLKRRVFNFQLLVKFPIEDEGKNTMAECCRLECKIHTRNHEQHHLTGTQRALSWGLGSISSLPSTAAQQQKGDVQVQTDRLQGLVYAASLRWVTPGALTQHRGPLRGAADAPYQSRLLVTHQNTTREYSRSNHPRILGSRLEL